MLIFGLEFIVRKPRKKRKKPTKGYTSRPWTAEDTQVILDSSNAGITAKEISIGILPTRTPAAIASRLNKIRKK